MSILTVGTMAFDSIETPFGKVDHVIGGACTYISWAASYWYDHINLVSIIGDDFPESEIEALVSRGVKTDGLVRVQGKKSFYWSGRYHNDMNGRDTLITDLNVLEDFSPILPKSFQSSKFIMLGNLTPSIQASILDQLSDPPKLVILDTMNFWMDVAMDELMKLLPRVDVLTVNDEEARQLSGERSLVKAAAVIHKMGPKYLVIKKGEHGALLFYENQIFFAPGLPVADVLDPTGAGDSFAGGMVGYLARTNDISFNNMKTAIIYGSVMASFCVEDFSLSKLKNLNQDEIYKRINQFENLSTFDVKELTVLNS
ncbi:MAG: bifunctional hydroxymethylpyrimidine kinase/phosphomethylpyrimidine kinase [Saprospiraceae bacterium]|nr:bifunctional hydroxymethylpyrimidine kinase/phosphomethylpyrimidine kinase [Candidatus Vicinibacter affinis]MBP6171983.1 bifunctional hydroxymethylpyrimidine kinase/phosphomethylpyrimidine kinase [Saprospiraceae bacterium]MBK6573150.1 bifunctional hydroxymethylpyrimidine kinase/phosphomethylpyrimidine kinase [Candidatus Vicinibacter affinis]MBK6822386.1 bifunctional hydroxymethylpyrimidine kinase/phosphomethylpyrimidine kinase [Candidatus Vicinibacter affinis]MBK7301832.1 bifunctional hydrox